MARMYVAQFDNVVVSAAQDLFGFYSGTAAFGRGCRLLRVVLSATNTTIPTSQMVQVVIRVFAGGATVTSGSAGAAATLQKIDPGDPAATWTARTNDTTIATTSGGTNNIVYDGGFHIYNGFDESFPVDGANPKGAQPIAIGVAAAASANSAAILVRTASVMSGTVNLSGTAWIEEFG